MNRLLITPKNAEKETPIATATASLEQDTPPAAAPPPAAERAAPAQPPVLLEIDTDVSLDGTPAQEWLVVTPHDLTVRGVGLRPANAPSPPLRQIPWSEVDQLRTTAGVGGGTLQVKTDGDWVDLIRYSNAFATRFHKVSRALEQAKDDIASQTKPLLLAAGGSGSNHTDDALDPPRCPSCSLRLQTREQSCPRCMQKGRILARVSELLAPYTRGAILLCLGGSWLVAAISWRLFEAPILRLKRFFPSGG
jgi:hypothetical protein